MFDRTYDRPPANLTVEDNRSLGLIYAVMALGCMYNISEDSGSDTIHYKEAMEEGYVLSNRWFWFCREKIGL